MVRGIIFDMDGTLTVPVIDFDAVRADLGLNGGDIAHQIRALPEPARQEAWAIVERHEAEARARTALQPGCLALLERCRTAGVRLALLTRNGPESISPLLELTGSIFDPVITRDFPQIKPHPAPAEAILKAWSIPASEVLLVGDYVHDIECGRAAGTRTCYFWNPGGVDYRAAADHWVRSMDELDELVFGE